MRSRPYSKYHQQYTKRDLKRFLTANGITYVWLGYQLGGMPEDINVQTNGKVDGFTCAMGTSINCKFTFLLDRSGDACSHCKR